MVLAFPHSPAAPPPPPGESPWLLRPAGPVGSRPVPEVSTSAADAVLVSAHGGSGNESVPVVVVCRSNVGGLVAAGRLLDAHREAPALGVLVVTDAPGRLPVPLARRVRLLEGLTVVWRIPWVEAWRRRGRSSPAPAVVTRVLDQVATTARTAAGR